jgi:hypothetical protein
LGPFPPHGSEGLRWWGWRGRDSTVPPWWVMARGKFAIGVGKMVGEDGVAVVVKGAGCEERVRSAIVG